MMKRIISIVCIFLLVLALPLSLAADKPAYISSEGWEVLSLTNAERTKERLQPLSVFDELQAVADLRASEIEKSFSHTRPDGQDWYTALDEIAYTSALENIAAGYKTPTNALDGWMNSTSHRENILNASAKHLAVGYYYDANSEYLRYWTQVFVGGCTTTTLNNVGTAPRFDRDGNLLSTESMLSVTCDQHGTSYIPLKDVLHYCDTNLYGASSYTVIYDGVSKVLPCTIEYTDVDSDAWYSESVTYAVNNRLMIGTSGSTFEPNATMTRAQLVTLLHRLEGTPAPTADAGFYDVDASAWYAEAVNWAAEIELVLGVGDHLFAPDQPITRAQLATILLRYHQYNYSSPSRLASLDSFADCNQIPDWSKTAFEWAYAENLMVGISKDGATYLDYNGSATRAQVATLLMRYIENL